MHVNDKYINCTGCSACAMACPHDAITMDRNEDGFIYPYVNDKCTDCSLCLKICPALSVDKYTNDISKCYAVMASDEIRKVSSSGGIFSVFAEYVISSGGYVCGAAFDSNMQLQHYMVDNLNDLASLRGSKYLESNLKDIFVKVKEKLILDNGSHYVLFTGTPCQVAGLKAYLRKDYDNLILVDLVCEGVPSQKVFDKYLKEKFPGEKVKEFSFRDKSKGWTITFNALTDKNRYIYSVDDDPYFQAFTYYPLSLRKECNFCDYNKKRPGDISIGDFWRIKEFYPDLDDKKGTSMLLVNTEWGGGLFRKIREEVSTS